MAIKVEDIIPFSSGTSHLGVNEGVNPGSFDASSITPFGHIVQLSGVFVDPVQGQSGILRFNQEQSAFETSTDGGVTFTAIGSDITLSGVVGVNGIDVEQLGGNFVIDAAAVSGLTITSLQLAYDGGNEITPAELPAGLHQPVVLKEVLPLDDEMVRAGSLKNFLLVASGISGGTNPEDANAGYFLGIGPNGLLLHGSGIRGVNAGFVGEEANELFIGYDSTTKISPFTPANNPMLRTKGSLEFIIGSGLYINVGENNPASDQGDFTLNATDRIRFAADGNVEHNAGELAQFQCFGSSGSLRYHFGPYESWYMRTMGQFMGGIFNDGFFPIAHSGQVNQMILETAPTTVDLKQAYDNGENVVLRTTGAEYVPILLEETTPGLAGTDGIFTDISNNAALMASGHTLTPNNPYTYHLAQLGSNGLVLRGSGSVSQHPALFSIGYQEGLSSPLLGRTDQPGLLSTGELTMRGVSGIAMRTTDGNVLIDTSTPFFFVTTGLGDVILAADGNVTTVAVTDVKISAGVADTPGGQVDISAFFGSGQLEYRFGPNEAWHVSPSHTSDFFPLAHSGQVVQMIQELASLQSSYEVNPDVTLNDGDMRIIASDDKLVLGTFGDKAPVNMSGIIGAPPDTDLELGDMWVTAHGYPDRDPGTTSQDEIAALSLGIPAIGIHAGASGIAPIVPASGITRYKNSALQTFTATTPTNIVFDTEYFDHDQFYEYDSSVTGIRVFVEGLYRVDANTLIFSNQTSTVLTTLNRNGSVISGSSASQLVLQNTFSGLHNYGLVNLNAGDYLSIAGVGTGGGSLTVLSAGDAAINLEYKGPPRGQAGG